MGGTQFDLTATEQLEGGVLIGGPPLEDARTRGGQTLWRAHALPGDRGTRVEDGALAQIGDAVTRSSDADEHGTGGLETVERQAVGGLHAVAGQVDEQANVVRVAARGRSPVDALDVDALNAEGLVHQFETGGCDP